MLSLVLRRCCSTRKIVYASSNAKEIYQRTRRLYETQSIAPTKTQDTAKTHLLLKQDRARKFQEVLLEVGREVSSAFNSAQSQKKIQQLSQVVGRHTGKLIQSCQPLEVEQLIQYVEIVKNMCFSCLSEHDQIETVYRQLDVFMKRPEHRQLVEDFTRSLWLSSTPFQYRVRAVNLLPYMSEQARGTYLSRIAPWVPYFKSAQVLILLYEKWRFNYSYPYQLLDEINKNDFYLQMQEMIPSSLKLLFVQSIRGQFSPNTESIYGKVLYRFQEVGAALDHDSFNKMVRMLHCESFFVQTEYTRAFIQYNLNNFINIAKNQNYDRGNITLTQMVEIYLGFQVSSSTGEILLNEITDMSRRTNFRIGVGNLELYKKLLRSVLRNVERKLKYERRDALNKEYTNDTVKFLKEFMPKYVEQWPEAIFQVNDAAHQLFPPNVPSALLTSFVDLFARIVGSQFAKITVKNAEFTLKILRFMVVYREKGKFVLPPTVYSSLLHELKQAKSATAIPNETLQILYLCLTLLQHSGEKQKFKDLIHSLNTDLIEAQMQKEMERQKSTGLINSLGHNVIWLSLCTAKVMTVFGLPINEWALEVFVNEKLFFMINSLQYLEVYEILGLAVRMERLRPEIYQKLMYNMSTFIIYIGDRSSKSTSLFYLNHRYLSYYGKICRLVLSHKQKFRPVVNKDCFKVLQIMLFREIANFKNQHLLDFLDILGDPSFLSISIQRHIEHIKFTAYDLEPYSSSKVLRSFQYYNPSLLRYYEGKYDEMEIKRRLRGDSLTSREIQEYFSKTEVYKTIIMNGDLNIRFELPQPQTALSDFKCMYICQRIYQRIKIFNSYDFVQGMRYDPAEKVAFTDVDLSSEKAYIDRQQLIPKVRENEMKIESRSLPKYIKLQVWKTFVFFDRECAIDAKDLYLNNQKLTDEILTKVLKGVYGSYEKVREVLKEFSCSEQLLSFVQEMKIPFQNNGASIEIKENGSQRTQLTLLSTNNVNYKIMHICAHLMAKNGFRVVIVKEGQKLQPLLVFLKLHFAGGEQGVRKQMQESESEQ